MKDAFKIIREALVTAGDFLSDSEVVFDAVNNEHFREALLLAIKNAQESKPPHGLRKARGATVAQVTLKDKSTTTINLDIPPEILLVMAIRQLTHNDLPKWLGAK